MLKILHQVDDPPLSDRRLDALDIPQSSSATRESLVAVVSINSVVGFADLPPFLPATKIDIYLQPRINGINGPAPGRFTPAHPRCRFHLPSLARPFEHERGSNIYHLLCRLNLVNNLTRDIRDFCSSS